jgi:predicted porin
MKKFFIILAATALIFAFTLPAAAQSEFTLYGSVHMDTMVTDTDFNVVGTRDTSPLTWDLSIGNWSSFGANIRVDDKLSGIIEWRSPPGGYLADDLNQSAWTGTYNMGFATLRLGRWWMPSFNPPPAWMVDSVGNAIVSVQEPRIALEGMKLGPVMFQITAAQAGEAGIGAWVTEQTMPKLEARADMSFGPITFALLGGYYSYDIYSNATTTAIARDVDSNFWGAIGTFTTGPFFFRASWVSIKNPVHYGGPPGALGAIQAAFDANNNIIDADRDLWQAYITYTLNPMISFNLCYGESKYEQSIGGFNNEDDQSGWFFTVPINITKNFTVRLEYSQLDNEDFLVNNVRTNESDVTKYGARWIFFF